VSAARDLGRNILQMEGQIRRHGGAFSHFADAFYNSAANYTTLGDSTVVVSARWRLLGPLEASAGMLMFGVSTAVIFAVIQRLLQARPPIS
jgi:hypothetical protein